MKGDRGERKVKGVRSKGRERSEEGKESDGLRGDTEVNKAKTVRVMGKR